jgi:hypothetical protein
MITIIIKHVLIGIRALNGYIITKNRSIAIAIRVKAEIYTETPNFLEKKYSKKK